MNRLWYTIAAVMVLAGLAHLGLLLVDGGPWDGPVSWRKPFTFGVSFGLSVATLAWVTGLAGLRPRPRAALVGVFTAASAVELTLITMQAWRGVPSHFNFATGFDSLVSATLAAGGMVLVVVTVCATVAVWRPRPEVAPSVLLAVRAGFGTLLASMAFGALMIAQGVTQARTGHQDTAYTVAAAIKPAHAVLMHGVLLLPALALLAGRTLPEERQRLRLVRLALGAYAVVAGVVCGLSLAGVTAAAPATASVLSAGTVSTVAMAALLWPYLTRRRPASAGGAWGPLRDRGEAPRRA
ncbi:hypothetical protein [Nonomuraea roseoviolacea]|uniref:DUF998 domain-containing protein n=1 Tax=Nonomuraea roseoviolacea subsp. carminata TaxID=160689 RepID=A0ABT1K3B4_9ACTN|nr:hypothetical protein [Nonomuraea roseoviolacea]MCP2348485.1 hypothetical protein [Nonomuraea roseoviolacea subsp. carminata]